MNEEAVDLFVARQMSWLRAALYPSGYCLGHKAALVESFARAYHEAYDSGYDDGFAEGQAAEGTHSGR